MKDGKQTEKSCGTQPFLTQAPSHQWGVDRLGQYAQQQHQVIVDGEKRIAPAYWRLGHSLTLARKQFARGHWSRFLKQWGIDKTRASKARAIFRTFSTEGHVEGKSVEEAYAERPRRQVHAHRRQAKLPAKVTSKVELVKRFSQDVAALVKHADAADPYEARELLVTVTHAIVQLEELEKELRQRAAPQLNPEAAW